MPAKKRWLTRDIVVQRAVQMANEAGDARVITLAAVARALEVRTPSLYNHVDGVDDLKRAMALYALRRLIRAIQEATVGLTGRDAVAATAVAYRQFALNSPGVYELTVRAPDADEQELVHQAQTLLQSLLLMLASMGLEGNDALHAVRGLRAILHGFVSLETAEGFKMTLDREESYKRVVDIFLDGLAPGSPA